MFVAQTEHPIYPQLRLVVWRLNDGSWSHDALSPLQEVGTPEPSTADERSARLLTALLDITTPPLFTAHKASR